MRKQLVALIGAWAASGILKPGKPSESDANGNKREGYMAGELPEDHEEDPVEDETTE